MMMTIFQVFDLLGKAKETDTVLRCAVREKVDKILEVKENEYLLCALSVAGGYFLLIPPQLIWSYLSSTGFLS